MSTHATVAEVEKQIAAFKADVASGLIKIRKGPRGPTKVYHWDVPDYRPGANKHAMIPMPFTLIEHDRHTNGLKYSSLCPRCHVTVIEVLTVFREGFSEWPPESGIPELCLECEDRLDAELEANQ